MVHSTQFCCISWRHFTVRRRVHRALLYPDVHVVEPSVLHFWRLVYSFRHPVRDVRGNCNRLVLLSLVCGGLQVAVEIVLYVRELEFIRVLVFCVLFLHKSGH